MRMLSRSLFRKVIRRWSMRRALCPFRVRIIDIKTIGQDEGIVYTAEVYVKPEVKLGEYKGIKAESPKAEVKGSAGRR